MTTFEKRIPLSFSRSAQRVVGADAPDRRRPLPKIFFLNIFSISKGMVSITHAHF
jgi:hypothetical protein